LSETLTQYEARVQRSIAALALDVQIKQVGPILTPTARPNQAPWAFDWALLFDDRLHIAIRERFVPTPKRFGPHGVRHMFTFHYGETPELFDPEGLPIRDNAKETKLRIDLDRWGPHIHFQGQDHIPQSKVEGLDIKDADMFRFVSSVLQHRGSTEPLDSTFGFRLL
jgi:hypothetical protein